MASRSIWSIVLLTGLSLVLASGAFASGSYTGSPPRPPGTKDKAKYELGKHVFMGDIQFASNSGAQGSQATMLAGYQGRLPRSARGKADLPAMAGKLSNAQLEALGYFLGVRYRIR